MASAWPRSSAPTPGIGAGRIDKADDGPGKLVGKFHRPDGLAIAFGLSTPEIPELPLLEIASFLMSHDHYRSAVINSHSGHDRRIVAKTAVSVDFGKILEKPFHIIQRVGTRIVARQERSPVGEAGIVLAQAFDFRSQMFNFVLSSRIHSPGST